jgi:putative ABC transport system permease protein
MNTDISQLEPKLTKCEQSHLPNYDLKNLSYSLLPLEDIHLHGNQINDLHVTGDIRNIYIFSIIACVILLIACMNYINLSNALMLRRKKEIGIQKIVGAKQIQLLLQYLGESFIVTIIAMGFSIVLSQLSLPLLNQISSKSLSIPYTDPKFLLMLFVLLIITSFLTGISPAVMMSSFQPVEI